MVMSLLACVGEASDVAPGHPSPAVDSLALRVAVTPTLDCLPVYVAVESGLFARESLSVVLVPFTAHMDCDTAFSGGSVHAMHTDLVRAERLAHQGTPLRYATTTALSWQLLTAKTARIRKLSQLDDKMLAMTRYSATAMLADHLSDSAKLDRERVFRIQVNDVLVRLNMMETGTMDAMLLPEPQATAARSLGCNMLYDSGSDSLSLGVIAFRKDGPADTVRLRRQMETFVRVYDEACDSINTLGAGHYRQLIESCCHAGGAIVDSLLSQRPPRFSHSRQPRQQEIDRARTWLGYAAPKKSVTKSLRGKGKKKGGRK